MTIQDIIAAKLPNKPVEPMKTMAKPMENNLNFTANLKVKLKFGESEINYKIKFQYYIQDSLNPNKIILFGQQEPSGTRFRIYFDLDTEELSFGHPNFSVEVSPEGYQRLIQSMDQNNPDIDPTLDLSEYI